MADHAVAMGAEHGEAHAPYLKVFVALLVLTVLEYLFAVTASRMEFPFLLLVLGLVVLALTKAALVGLFFMHVRYEGRWVFLLIVPATVMATIVVLGVYPDIGTGHRRTREQVPNKTSGATSWMGMAGMGSPS
jgi:cytochrome c oxidase subunit 4